MVLLVALPGYQKLINQFLLFQYSCLYISAKKRNFWTSHISLERAWSAVYFVQVWKLQVFRGPRKSPLILRSLKTRFCSWFFQVAKKLINQFLLFQYSCLYITAKKRNSWTFYTSLEKAWSAVYCVQVWKLQFFHRPWKFLLNIDSIEFCYKFTNKDSSWSSKAH